MNAFPSPPGLINGAIVGFDPVNPAVSMCMFQHRQQTFADSWMWLEHGKAHGRKGVKQKADSQRRTGIDGIKLKQDGRVER